MFIISLTSLIRTLVFLSILYVPRLLHFNNFPFKSNEKILNCIFPLISSPSDLYNFLYLPNHLQLSEGLSSLFLSFLFFEYSLDCTQHNDNHCLTCKQKGKQRRKKNGKENSTGNCAHLIGILVSELIKCVQFPSLQFIIFFFSFRNPMTMRFSVFLYKS